MSYTIVYDSHCIKAGDKYTLFVLMGDNNVYEANNRRRARSWSALILNKTAEEVEDFFSSWLGHEYQEHFKRNGKWVDDAAPCPLVQERHQERFDGRGNR